MADKREVVIVGAARAPIGAYGGSLKDFTACDLGAHVVKAAFARAGVDCATSTVRSRKQIQLPRRIAALLGL